MPPNGRVRVGRWLSLLLFLSAFAWFLGGMAVLSNGGEACGGIAAVFDVFQHDGSSVCGHGSTAGGVVLFIVGVTSIVASTWLDRRQHKQVPLQTQDRRCRRCPRQLRGRSTKATWPWLPPSESGITGNDGRLRTVGQLQFRQDVRDVVAHGLSGDIELTGYGGGRRPGGKEVEDLQFARGQ